MRKRKPAPPTAAQAAVLRAFANGDAFSAADAVKPPPFAEANTLNRLFSRGWLAKAEAGRWWLSAEGQAALPPETEPQDVAQ